MRQQKRKQLDPSGLVFIIFVYNVALSSDSFSFALTLLPESVDQWVMSDVTLKCLNEGRSIVKWFYNTQEASMGLTSGTCRTFPNFLTNSPNLYEYSCSDHEFTVTLKNISKLNHGDIWRCQTFEGAEEFSSNAITIQVKVPITTLTIGPYYNTLLGKENMSISLQCTTSPCRPEPKFLWYREENLMTDRNDILLANVSSTSVGGIQTYISTYSTNLTRELNGWFFFCAAYNQNTSLFLSDKILLNVTYPPDWPPSISNLTNKGEFKVLQNDFVRLECSITGGNPLPRLEWDKYNDLSQQINGNTVTKTTYWRATGQDSVDLTCQSFHTHRNDYVHITITILYPPDKPDVSIKMSSGIYVNVNKSLSIIEGQTFKLNCSAKSNPPVSLFKWNDLKTDLSNVYTARSDRQTQSISCYVSNEMRFSDSRKPVTGYNITRLEVDVLYPPTVNKMPDRSVNEGDDVIYRCNFEPGNPSDTNVTWSWNGTTWNDLQLTISNVSMNQEGLYRCDVRNFMVSSDGNKAFGNASGVFYLSVESYKNDNYSPSSSNVSVVAASAAGTVVGVVFLAAVFIIFMVYKRRKRLSYQKKDDSIQYYNFNQSEVISAKADNANAYEAFQHTGSDRQYDSLSPEDCKTETKNDCQISAEGGHLHVYEGLQTKGFDQQYETISPSASDVKMEQHKVYENLQ